MRGLQIDDFSACRIRFYGRSVRTGHDVRVSKSHHKINSHAKYRDGYITAGTYLQYPKTPLKMIRVGVDMKFGRRFIQPKRKYRDQRNGPLNGILF